MSHNLLFRGRHLGCSNCPPREGISATARWGALGRFDVSVRYPSGQDTQSTEERRIFLDPCALRVRFSPVAFLLLPTAQMQTFPPTTCFRFLSPVCSYCTIPDRLWGASGLLWHGHERQCSVCEGGMCGFTAQYNVADNLTCQRWNEVAPTGTADPQQEEEKYVHK
jgi:hypothetical protein